MSSLRQRVDGSDWRSRAARKPLAPLGQSVPRNSASPFQSTGTEPKTAARRQGAFEIATITIPPNVSRPPSNSPCPRSVAPPCGEALSPRGFWNRLRDSKSLISFGLIRLMRAPVVRQWETTECVFGTKGGGGASSERATISGRKHGPRLRSITLARQPPHHFSHNWANSN